MNNDELKKLAAVLNGIAEGKKWEWRSKIDGIWTPQMGDVMSAVTNGYQIRLKQWHLPAPPDGYEWHRTDWTEEMLPDGWRPQYLGESNAEYEASCDGLNWTRYSGAYSIRAKTPQSLTTFFRTKAPLPPQKPKLREVQLCEDDIKAGDEFLSPSGKRLQWDEIYSIEIAIGGVWKSWQQLKDEGWKIRSIGETEWRKCSRMEEVPA